jgi:hypothetical protein
VLGEFRDYLLEQVKLHSQSVEQNEHRTFAGLDEAQLVAADLNGFDWHIGCPAELGRRFGFGRSASMAKEKSHTPMPMATKMTRGHKDQFIERSS